MNLESLGRWRVARATIAGIGAAASLLACGSPAAADEPPAGSQQVWLEYEAWGPSATDYVLDPTKTVTYEPANVAPCGGGSLREWGTGSGRFVRAAIVRCTSVYEAWGYNASFWNASADARHDDAWLTDAIGPGSNWIEGSAREGGFLAGWIEGDFVIALGLHCGELDESACEAEFERLAHSVGNVQPDAFPADQPYRRLGRSVSRDHAVAGLALDNMARVDRATQARCGSHDPPAPDRSPERSGRDRGINRAPRSVGGETSNRTRVASSLFRTRSVGEVVAWRRTVGLHRRRCAVCRCARCEESDQGSASQGSHAGEEDTRRAIPLRECSKRVRAHRYDCRHRIRGIGIRQRRSL